MFLHRWWEVGGYWRPMHPYLNAIPEYSDLSKSAKKCFYKSLSQATNMLLFVIDFIHHCRITLVDRQSPIWNISNDISWKYSWFLAHTNAYSRILPPKNEQKKCRVQNLRFMELKKNPLRRSGWKKASLFSLVKTLNRLVTIAWPRSLRI